MWELALGLFQWLSEVGYVCWTAHPLHKYWVSPPEVKITLNSQVSAQPHPHDPPSLVSLVRSRFLISDVMLSPLSFSVRELGRY